MTRFCGSRDILKVHKIKAKHWSALCQQVVSLQALMLSLDRCIMTSYYSSNWTLDNHVCCKLWRKLLYKRRPPNHSPRSSCDIQECIAHEARMFFYGRMSCRSICPVCMLYLHSLFIKNSCVLSEVVDTFLTRLRYALWNEAAYLSLSSSRNLSKHCDRCVWFPVCIIYPWLFFLPYPTTFIARLRFPAFLIWKRRDLVSLKTWRLSGMQRLSRFSS